MVCLVGLGWSHSIAISIVFGSWKWGISPTGNISPRYWTGSSQKPVERTHATRTEFFCYFSPCAFQGQLWGCAMVVVCDLYKETEQLRLPVLNDTRLVPPPLLTPTRLHMAAAAVRISLTPCWSLLYLFAADNKHYMELGKLVVLLEATWLAPWAQIYFIMQWEFNGAAARRREGTGCFTYRLVPQWWWLTGAVIPSSAFLQPATNIEQFHPSKQISTQNHSIPETRAGLIPYILLSNQMGLKDPCITILFSSFLMLRSMVDL